MYETVVIYRTQENENSFYFNGFTYYRTDKTRRPKKQDNKGKLISITEQEFKEQQDRYNFLFDKKINII